MSGTFASRAPITRRESMDFVRLVSLDGLGPKNHALRFRREILWLVESSSTFRVVANGRDLSKGPTHNDYYGIFTSPDEVLAAAHLQAEDLGLSGPGPIIVEVTSIREETPALDSDEPKSLGRPCYRTPGQDWLIDDDLFAAWFADPRGDTAGPRRLKTEEQRFVIWRSDWTKDENDAAYARARAAIVPAAPVQP